LAKLQDGVSGNLKNELQLQREVEGSVTRNVGKGQHLHYVSRSSGECVRVEVRIVYDMIMSKHYAVVASELNKLKTLRDTGCNDKLYQVVFFLRLPHLDYPAGIW
jgi:hypothetical protein